MEKYQGFGIVGGLSISHRNCSSKKFDCCIFSHCHCHIFSAHLYWPQKLSLRQLNHICLSTHRKIYPLIEQERRKRLFMQSLTKIPQVTSQSLTKQRNWESKRDRKKNLEKAYKGPFLIGKMLFFWPFSFFLCLFYNRYIRKSTKNVKDEDDWETQIDIFLPIFNT